MPDTKELARSASIPNITKEQKELIMRTVAKGCTEDEFMLFMEFCRAQNLHPLMRQVYPVKYAGTLAFITSIDAYRSIAQDTGEMDGQDGPYWCGDDGKWVEVWTAPGIPAASKVIIHRKGHAHPYIGIANYGAYATGSNFWKMPKAPAQLAKCAEALGLRKAFPRQLGNVYTKDEMEQADPPRDVTPVSSDLNVSRKQIDSDVKPQAQAQAPAPASAVAAESQARTQEEPAERVEVINICRVAKVSGKKEFRLFYDKVSSVLTRDEALALKINEQIKAGPADFQCFYGNDGYVTGASRIDKE